MSAKPSAGAGTAGRSAAFIQAVLSWKLPVNPDRLASSWKVRSSSLTGTSNPLAECFAACSIARVHTTSGSRPDARGTMTGSHCQASLVSHVSRTPATGPSSSIQKSFSTSSDGRGLRHHHCTSAASQRPAWGSARRARCRSSVASISASSPAALTSCTDTSVSPDNPSQPSNGAASRRSLSNGFCQTVSASQAGPALRAARPRTRPGADGEGEPESAVRDTQAGRKF